MPHTRRLVLAAGLTALAAAAFSPAFAAAPDYAAPGPYPVKTVEGVWHDPGRNRDVPWLVRYPDAAPGLLPVVVFSHGLGGSRYGAAYYGDHLASHGYAVLYVQHPGSDNGIFENLRAGVGQTLDQVLASAVRDPKVALDRFGDIPFALDQLKALDGQPGPLQGRLDLARIGMSGHSFGAVTTQAMAGQRYPAGALGEPRFKAFLAMSPSSDRRGNDAQAFAGFTRPFLFLTGTQDVAPVAGTDPDPADRLKPYAFTPATTPAVQMVLNGGDHMVFSGRVGTGRPRDARFHALVQAVSLAFWDAYLKDDDAALHWLRDGGMAGLAGADAVVSAKGPPR